MTHHQTRIAVAGVGCGACALLAASRADGRGTQGISVTSRASACVGCRAVAVDAGWTAQRCRWVSEWCGVVRYGGVVWCGVVRCGAVWCGVMACVNRPMEQLAPDQPGLQVHSPGVAHVPCKHPAWQMAAST